MNIPKLTIVFLACFSVVLCAAQTQNQFIKAGNEAYQNGEYYEAIKYFGEALKFDKQQTDLHYKIGMAYYDLKDYQSAVNSLEKVDGVSITNDFPLLYFYKGTTQKLLGNYDEAIVYFQKFRDNYRTNDFYSKKVQNEIAASAWAKDQSQQENFNIIQLNKPVNTGYSEFSATPFSQEMLQVSSLQPADKSDNKSPFVSNIYFYKDGNKGWEEVKSLPSLQTNEKEIGNGFYLSEYNKFYFTLCEPISAIEKRCDLYVSELKNDTWSAPKALNINDSNFTNTQPMATVVGDEIWLFFVSDRDGGEGKLDIWWTISNDGETFSEVKNIGAPINSIDNESTPFYEASTSTLYFSSEWNYGFGGYDIFKASFTDGEIGVVSNLGAPTNSSANDQYFYKFDEQHSYLSSNREGAMQLRGSACCYDIYQFEEEKTEIPPDTLLVTTPLDTPTLEPTPIDKLLEMLPTTVYFHNDEPNPKTTQTVTGLGYSECYADYIRQMPEYYEFYADDAALDKFFQEKVDKGFVQLKTFAEQLELALATDNIELTLEGYCSPLAKNQYNINLAKRRIVSLQNYFLRWNDGALKDYYNEGKLSFVSAPFGEEKAPSTVSDDYYNTTASIFNPAAASERKVAIIAVKVQ